MRRNRSSLINSTDAAAQNKNTEAMSVPEAGPRNRRALWIASSPLLLLAGACLFSVVQRQVIDRMTDKPFGKLSRTQAQQIATEVCGRLTGQPVQMNQATYQSAYSLKRGVVVREWDVLCSTPDAQYLLRINAETRRVYAVNRLSDEVPAAKVAVPSVAAGMAAGGAAGTSVAASNVETENQYSIGGVTPRVSRHEAEQQAKRYLSMMGVPSQALHSVSEGTATTGGEQWNFTFRRQVPGLGNRLLKVSIDGRNGGLEHIWNPVYAL
jgi:hypothetical protein